MLVTPYEKIWDMPYDGFSDEKQAPRWLGNVIWVLLSVVFKICFRYEITGRENLRAFKGETGVVLIGNHVSYLDVICMYMATRPDQWPRFMGRDNLWPKLGGLMGHVISRVGAFPVKRDAADRTAIKRASRMLKNGEVVGIMPEGTRRGKSDRDPHLHSGAAFIARMGNAPILPMTVRDIERVKQKGERLRFPKVTIEYGTPVLVSDFDFLPKDERLDGCTWYAMREVFALSQRIPAEQVDMKALFPEDRDFTDVFAEHAIPKRSSEEVVADIRAKRLAKEQAAALKAAETPAEPAAPAASAASAASAAPAETAEPAASEAKGE